MTEIPLSQSELIDFANSFESLIVNFTQDVQDVPQRPNNNYYDEDLASLSLTEAARLEKIEKVIEIRDKIAFRRKGLLGKEVVKIAFMKFFAVHTGEFHPLGDKISQDLAAVFEDDDETKATQAREVVDKHIFKTLAHIKRLMNDFCQEQMDELVIKDEPL